MTSYILNENFTDNKFFFEKGIGNKIFFKKKYFFDLSYCSGVLFLGHSNKIFQKTLKEILKNKISIFSSPNLFAFKLCKNIKTFFLPFEKLVFCNTGSESVIKALRISRAINKNKEIIVCVTGSWHGSVDQTLFSPNKKDLLPYPLSSGLKESDKKNIIFIPYNDIKISQKILNKYVGKINSILIEPITASLPLNTSVSYLRFLKSYSKKNKITLIFDEIITGFRSKGGSVQKQFNIKPDITLMGKILGGGFPIGAIAVTKDIATKINKLNKKVFFGGTFSANAFSMLAGNNTINYIKNNKKSVNALIKNCLFFEKTINAFLIKNNVDARVYRFDSILRIVFSKHEVNNRIQRDFLEKKTYLNKIKFVKFLLSKNIYYPKNGIIFLSLENNNKKELSYIIESICTGLKLFFTSARKTK